MIKSGTITPTGSGATGVSEDRIAAIKEQVKGFVHRSEQRVGDLRHRVNEAKDQAMTRGGALVDKATDYIKENPMKAVGIAFGAGYLGTRLFRR